VAIIGMHAQIIYKHKQRHQMTNTVHDDFCTVEIRQHLNVSLWLTITFRQSQYMSRSTHFRTYCNKDYF